MHIQEGDNPRGEKLEKDGDTGLPHLPAGIFSISDSVKLPFVSLLSHIPRTKLMEQAHFFKTNHFKVSVSILNKLIQTKGKFIHNLITFF